MEVDIMVHRAPLLNKIVIAFCVSLLACSNPNDQEQHSNTVKAMQLIHQTDSSLSNHNGVIYHKDQPFSGIIYSLYPSSTDTATIQAYSNGLENGEWRKMHASGRLKESRFFVNGKKEGDYTIYWESGKKQLAYHFLNDEYEGVCKEWNEAGRLTKAMTYVKGHEEGSQQWWYDNGKIKANYVIINGRRFGLLGTKNCINVSDSIFKK